VIRINLLGVERTARKKAFVLDLNQRITLACSLVLVAAALGIGWWYWVLDQESLRRRSRRRRGSARCCRKCSSSRRGGRSCSSASG
jgi:hypothetical protein